MPTSTTSSLRFLISVGLIFVGLIFALLSSSRGQENRRAELQFMLDEWHGQGQFAGATLGAILNDGTVLSLSTGYSDRDQQTLMQPDARMLAGSVGKTFAAATALQLFSEGKFDLDDKIEKYLEDEPWFARLPNAHDITIRQLMNHTSGLVRYEFKDQFTKDLTNQPTKWWKPEELLAYLFDEKAPFDAGQGWDYSDTNYIVLGMILEKVSGEPFYAQAKRRILDPLQLTNTIPQEGPQIEKLIPGYAGLDNPFGGQDCMLKEGRLIINPQFEWTGGGYASTSTDLARWAKYYFEGQAFPSTLMPQVLDGIEAPMLGRGASYGLGAILRNTPSGKCYGHSGFFPGYMTDMMYFPDHRIAIAVQVNSSVPKDLGKPLSRVLLDAIKILTSP